MKKLTALITIFYSLVLINACSNHVPSVEEVKAEEVKAEETKVTETKAEEVKAEVTK